MAELREFARHSDDLEHIGVVLIPISVDNQQHAHDLWEKVAQKKFTILSDPGAKVIRRYGVLHEHGSHNRENRGADIALCTTILIGPDGREQWRRVSRSVPDIPSWDEPSRRSKQRRSARMAWIRTIEEAEAEGELKGIYSEQRNADGDLANILKIHSLAPDVLKTHLALYQASMHAPGELSRAHREMIAVAVSAANNCHY